MYVRVSASATLPCDSSQSGTSNEIIWYVTETRTTENRIILHIPGTGVFTDTAHSDRKHEYNENDYSLKIKNVQYSDEMKYTCTLSFTGIPLQIIVIQLIVLGK